MKIDAYLAETETGFWTATSDLSFEESIGCIAEYGFDGIEVMTGNLKRSNARTIKKTARSYDLDIIAVASGFIYFQHGLSFTHHIEKVRKSAVNKTKECVEFANNLGAKYVSIGLVRGQTSNRIQFNVAWKYLVESIQECGKFASLKEVILAVEPENRYETDYVHTVDEGLRLIQEVGLESVQLMVDTFHMNIEEQSIGEAIKKAGEKLVHVHIADSNRLAPGMGHIDFTEVIGALRDIGYDGYLGLEILLKPTLESAIQKGIQHIKNTIG